jgi:hypothetical protein
MRRSLQAANASIHVYPPHTYNRNELRGQQGKSVPMTRAGSIPFKTTDVWGVVAKHTKILDFPSNKNKLQPLPGESVPILRAPNQMYSAHTLAQTMEREGLKPVKVAVVDPHERRAIIRDIHKRLQKKYAAHYASALNTRNVGVIHSMIESSSSIMAAKGNIPTDVIARHLVRVPQVIINVPTAIPSALITPSSSPSLPAAIPSALVTSSASSASSASPAQSVAPSTAIGPPALPSYPPSSIASSAPPSYPPSSIASTAPPSYPPSSIASSAPPFYPPGSIASLMLEEKSTDVERPIGESVSEMGESFGPMREDEHDVSILGKPYPISDDEIALVSEYAKVNKKRQGQIKFVSVPALKNLLNKMSITDTDIEKRYPNNHKVDKIRYLIDINPLFRDMVFRKTLTPDGVKSLIEQTGKGRQVGKGKKVRAGLRSGMFGITHKKMVHQPTRSYRNQLI